MRIDGNDCDSEWVKVPRSIAPCRKDRMSIATPAYKVLRSTEQMYSSTYRSTSSFWSAKRQIFI